jgi:hypothetical protein
MLLIFIRPREGGKVDVYYLWWLLKTVSASVIVRLKHMATGTTGRQRIPVETLTSLEVPRLPEEVGDGEDPDCARTPTSRFIS